MALLCSGQVYMGIVSSLGHCIKDTNDVEGIQIEKNKENKWGWDREACYERLKDTTCLEKKREKAVGQLLLSDA